MSARALRIAVVNWTSRQVGGPEGYLHHVLPHLASAGHALGYWHETDEPADRAPVALPAGTPAWCARTLGRDRALAALHDWRPDVLYAHGLLDPGLEDDLLDVAPGVFFPHSYYGTCISGAKAFTFPTVRPCQREFGPACLALYYPRRTGGLNPVTMVREYRRQAARLGVLRRYVALVTNSEHMRREYLRHGLGADRVTTIPYYVPDVRRPAPPRTLGERPRRLLFLGRMDPLKGGAVLLDALPAVARAVGPLRLTLAGDGPARADWERHAARTLTSRRDIELSWAGWASGAALERLFDETDLLAMPSLWPEPFGRVGPEAAGRGIPAAAFDVGGISEWLLDGHTGHLAPGDPPTAAGLAHAIIRCLADPGHYAHLSAGALEGVGRFSASAHLGALLPILETAARDG